MLHVPHLLWLPVCHWQKHCLHPSNHHKYYSTSPPSEQLHRIGSKPPPPNSRAHKLLMVFSQAENKNYHNVNNCTWETSLQSFLIHCSAENQMVNSFISPFHQGQHYSYTLLHSTPYNGCQVAQPHRKPSEMKLYSAHCWWEGGRKFLVTSTFTKFYLLTCLTIIFKLVNFISIQAFFLPLSCCRYLCFEITYLPQCLAYFVVALKWNFQSHYLHSHYLSPVFLPCALKPCAFSSFVFG